MFFLLHHFRTWATTLLQYLQVLRIQVNLVQNFYYRLMAQVKKKTKKRITRGMEWNHSKDIILLGQTIDQTVVWTYIFC